MSRLFLACSAPRPSPARRSSTLQINSVRAFLSLDARLSHARPGQQPARPPASSVPWLGPWTSSAQTPRDTVLKGQKNKDTHHSNYTQTLYPYSMFEINTGHGLSSIGWKFTPQDSAPLLHFTCCGVWEMFGDYWMCSHFTLNPVAAVKQIKR